MTETVDFDLFDLEENLETDIQNINTRNQENEDASTLNTSCHITFDLFLIILSLFLQIIIFLYEKVLMLEDKIKEVDNEKKKSYWKKIDIVWPELLIFNQYWQHRTFSYITWQSCPIIKKKISTQRWVSSYTFIPRNSQKNEKINKTWFKRWVSSYLSEAEVGTSESRSCSAIWHIRKLSDKYISFMVKGYSRIFKCSCLHARHRAYIRYITPEIQRV